MRVDSPSYNEGERFKDNPQIPDFLVHNSSVAVAIVVILIVVGVIATNGLVRVPAGYRGVLLTFGKAEDRILQEGLNFKIPFIQTIKLMNVQIQKAESTESTATKDLQEVSTTIAVNFRLNTNAVDEIYRDLRSDYVDRVIKPNIEESLKATTAQFNAEELITNRALVKSEFDNILKERIGIFNIEVVAVSLTDFQFSQAFDDAIEAKVTARQEALRAKNVLKQVRFEAQQQIIQANAEKNATITRARGEAQAKIIAANATANVIKVITSQMTQEYAKYLWLTQWDGELPAVLGGDREGYYIDLKSIIEEES